jgi:hypothetical protein
MATNFPTISLPTINVPTTRTADFGGTAATANLQTGFSAQNTFGAGQANFAALGSPDAMGSGLQQLTAVVQALGQIVQALGQLVAALKGGGAENAQAKPDAGGAEQPQTGTAAKEDPNAKPAADANAKPADGGGAAGGAGGADQANAAGGGATDLLSTLAPLLQSLTEIIKALQEEEDAKAQDAKAGGKKGAGGHAQRKEGPTGGAQRKEGGTRASAHGKEHAAANSRVGQQAQMEKLNQAVMQILTSLIQLLGPMLQQLAGQMKDNPQAAAAGQAVNDILKNPGGGGAAGGVVMAR